MLKSEQPKPRSFHAPSLIGLAITFVLILGGCQQQSSQDNEGPPTLRQAVVSLAQYDQAISEALRAKNPAAADKQIHDAMYLADHLPEFATSLEIDHDQLKSNAKRLLELLLKAHTGAHGGTDGWDPNAVADEMTSIVAQLEILIENQN